MIKNLILITVLFALSNGSQDVPIQQRGYGFSVGDPYGTLHIQFFLDFQCPDSKQSFQTWRNVRKSLSLQQNKVKLTYQFNPLPYHFYATYIHEAFFYVLKHAGALQAEDFIQYVFDRQEKYTEQLYINKTATQFAQQFSKQIGNLFNINPQLLIKQFVIGSESFTTLKNHWRYTTIEKGVAGAPIFYANGVRIDGAEDYKYLDWINFIKEYKS